ncbi:MAG: rhodanese-like domain-containing protein [Ilumatobacter sp.]
MKSSEEMVAQAREAITEHSPAEALRRQHEDGALIVDIRDVRELQHEGVIPAAMHAPRGMLEFWVDPASPYHKPVFAEDREFIFHCAAGFRSALSTQILNGMGMTNASHVAGGFKSWRDEGQAVTTYEEWKAAKRA